MNMILRYSLLFFIGAFFYTWIHESVHALTALTLGLQVTQFTQIPFGQVGSIVTTSLTPTPFYVNVLVSIAPYITFLVLGGVAVGFNKPKFFAFLAYGVFLNLTPGEYGDFQYIQTQIGVWTKTVVVSLQALTLIEIVGFFLIIGWEGFLALEKLAAQEPTQ